MIRNLARLLKHNEKGFTLIELIIVVAILGVLAAIAVPRFTSKTDEAKRAAAQAEVRTMQNILEIYYAETDVYPKTENDAWDLLEDNGVGGGRNDKPLDPWEREYQYDTTQHVFYSKGPDENNSDDDIYPN